MTGSFENPLAFHRGELAKLQAKAKPLLQDSPCATCWVANPNKDAFYGYDGPDITPGVMRDRLDECARRLVEAVAGRCPGPIEEQQEMFTYKEEEQAAIPQPSRAMQIIRALAPKIGLPVRPTETPEPKVRNRNIVLRSPGHCGQDAPRYRQR